MNLPQEFIDKQSAFGEEGKRFLYNLPKMITHYKEIWEISQLFPHFEDLSYNYAAPGKLADGQAIVFKIGTMNWERPLEINALRLYDGNGIARLLQFDLDTGAMLMEWVRPGKMLSELEDDDKAVEITADLITQMKTSLDPNHPFPDLVRWTQSLTQIRKIFDGSTGPFPKQIVERAKNHLSELLASPDEIILMHADLHHFNILSSERNGWLAIDPKGVAGESAYEVIPFLLNRLNVADKAISPTKHLQNWLAVFSERLGTDNKRMLTWGFVHCILSAVWTYEDHQVYDAETIEMAEIFEELLKNPHF